MPVLNQEILINHELSHACLKALNTTVKEAKSATMNIFWKKYFLFKSFVKVELSSVFTINMFTIAETAWKSELSYKIGVCFLLLVIICVPPIIMDSYFLT